MPTTLPVAIGSVAAPRRRIPIPWPNVMIVAVLLIAGAALYCDMRRSARLHEDADDLRPQIASP